MEIEEIQGVGDKTAEKLRELGITTVARLAVSTPQELALVGLKEANANKILFDARTSLGFGFKRVSELVKRKTVLTTGVKALDSLIGGGVESKLMSMVYGSEGTGKTILAHQLAVTAHLPVEKGGLGGGVAFIDTEYTFNETWISRIAERFGITELNIHKAEAVNMDHQILIAESSIDPVIEENDLKLIVVDSLTRHFRAELTGRETLAERQQRLHKHIHALRRSAVVHNIPLFVTNQVSDRPDSYLHLVDYVGGHIAGHNAGLMLFVRKARASRIFKMTKHLDIPEGECEVALGDGGFVDVPERRRVDQVSGEEDSGKKREGEKEK